MNQYITRIPVTDMKQALDRAMSACASHSNRVNALYLLATSGALDPATFTRIIGQAPETLERDLAIAHEEFEHARADYEDYCKRQGVPAYATYNED